MQIVQFWNVYFDTCCLNRLFDPQIQERIRRETEVIDIIFSHFYTGRLHWIASGVLRFEINQNPDSDQRSELRTLLRSAHRTVFAGEMEYSRGAELKSLGFKHYDALHIVCAESGGADVLLTTDDRMLRLAKRYHAQLRVRVENPYAWFQEIS